MPVKWVLSPVSSNPMQIEPAFAVVDPETEIPVCIDPSTGGPYNYSAVYGDGWCLALVHSNDFSALLAFAGVVDLLEYECSRTQRNSILMLTGRELGWTQQRLNRIRNRLSDKDVATTGISLDTSVLELVRRLGKRGDPNFEPLRLETRAGEFD